MLLDPSSLKTGRHNIYAENTPVQTSNGSSIVFSEALKCNRHHTLQQNQLLAMAAAGDTHACQLIRALLRVCKSSQKAHLGDSTFLHPKPPEGNTIRGQSTLYH